MKKLNVKKILKTNTPAAIVTITGVVIFLTGYYGGWTDYKRMMAKGIGKCWAQDPTLQEHMMNAAMKLSGD